MRKTRLVILPGVRSITQIGCLLLFLACPTIAFKGQERRDVDPICTLHELKSWWFPSDGKETDDSIGLKETGWHCIDKGPRRAKGYNQGSMLNYTALPTINHQKISLGRIVCNTQQLCELQSESFLTYRNKVIANPNIRNELDIRTSSERKAFLPTQRMSYERRSLRERIGILRQEYTTLKQERQDYTRNNLRDSTERHISNRIEGAVRTFATRKDELRMNKQKHLTGREIKTTTLQVRLRDITAARNRRGPLDSYQITSPNRYLNVQTGTENQSERAEQTIRDSSAARSVRSVSKERRDTDATVSRNIRLFKIRRIDSSPGSSRRDMSRDIDRREHSRIENYRSIHKRDINDVMSRRSERAAQIIVKDSSSYPRENRDYDRTQSRTSRLSELRRIDSHIESSSRDMSRLKPRKEDSRLENSERRSESGDQTFRDASMLRDTRSILKEKRNADLSDSRNTRLYEHQRIDSRFDSSRRDFSRDIRQSGARKESSRMDNRDIAIRDSRDNTERHSEKSDLTIRSTPLALNARSISTERRDSQRAESRSYRLSDLRIDARSERVRIDKPSDITRLERRKDESQRVNPRHILERHSAYKIEPRTERAIQTIRDSSVNTNLRAVSRGQKNKDESRNSQLPERTRIDVQAEFLRRDISQEINKLGISKKYSRMDENINIATRDSRRNAEQASERAGRTIRDTALPSTISRYSEESGRITSRNARFPGLQRVDIRSGPSRSDFSKDIRQVKARNDDFRVDSNRNIVNKENMDQSSERADRTRQESSFTRNIRSVPREERGAYRSRNSRSTDIRRNDLNTESASRDLSRNIYQLKTRKDDSRMEKSRNILVQRSQNTQRSMRELTLIRNKRFVSSERRDSDRTDSETSQLSKHQKGNILTECSRRSLSEDIRQLETRKDDSQMDNTRNISKRDNMNQRSERSERTIRDLQDVRNTRSIRRERRDTVRKDIVIRDFRDKTERHSEGPDRIIRDITLARNVRSISREERDSGRAESRNSRLSELRRIDSRFEPGLFDTPRNMGFRHSRYNTERYSERYGRSIRTTPLGPNVKSISRERRDSDHTKSRSYQLSDLRRIDTLSASSRVVTARDTQQLKTRRENSRTVNIRNILTNDSERAHRMLRVIPLSGNTRQISTERTDSDRLESKHSRLPELRRVNIQTEPLRRDSYKDIREVGTRNNDSQMDKSRNIRARDITEYGSKRSEQSYRELPQVRNTRSIFNDRRDSDRAESRSSGLSELRRIQSRSSSGKEASKMDSNRNIETRNSRNIIEEHSERLDRTIREPLAGNVRSISRERRDLDRAESRSHLRRRTDALSESRQHDSSRDIRQLRTRKEDTVMDNNRDIATRNSRNNIERHSDRLDRNIRDISLAGNVRSISRERRDLDQAESRSYRLSERRRTDALSESRRIDSSRDIRQLGTRKEDTIMDNNRDIPTRNLKNNFERHSERLDRTIREPLAGNVRFNYNERRDLDRATSRSYRLPERRRTDGLSESRRIDSFRDISQLRTRKEDTAMDNSRDIATRDSRNNIERLSERLDRKIRDISVVGNLRSISRGRRDLDRAESRSYRLSEHRRTDALSESRRIDSSREIRQLRTRKEDAVMDNIRDIATRNSRCNIERHSDRLDRNIRDISLAGNVRSISRERRDLDRAESRSYRLSERRRTNALSESIGIDSPRDIRQLRTRKEGTIMDNNRDFATRNLRNNVERHLERLDRKIRDISVAGKLRSISRERRDLDRAESRSYRLSEHRRTDALSESRRIDSSRDIRQLRTRKEDTITDNNIDIATRNSRNKIERRSERLDRKIRDISLAGKDRSISRERRDLDRAESRAYRLSEHRRTDAISDNRRVDLSRDMPTRSTRNNIEQHSERLDRRIRGIPIADIALSISKEQRDLDRRESRSYRLSELRRIDALSESKRIDAPRDNRQLEQLSKREARLHRSLSFRMQPSFAYESEQPSEKSAAIGRRYIKSYEHFRTNPDAQGYFIVNHKISENEAVNKYAISSVTQIDDKLFNARISYSKVSIHMNWVWQLLSNLYNISKEKTDHLIQNMDYAYWKDYKILDVFLGTAVTIITILTSTAWTKERDFNFNLLNCRRIYF